MAGHGHTTKYLDRSRVTTYVALEPNTNMHSVLRAAANVAGYNESDESLLILSCGAEDTTSILSSLPTKNGGPVDTIVSILTLCSVPNVQTAIQGLAKEVLRPGGTFLFFEHVRSKRSDIVWWQKFWSPLWGTAFGGCNLNRATDVWISEVGGEGERVWKEKDIEGMKGEMEETLFRHSIGRMVKHQQTMK